jgi:DNA-binding winged helix-turn-helix (wHTH) protein
MNQAQTETAGYRFDNFYLDRANRQLWRDGKLLALNSKYFDVLLLLLSRSGQLVEKARIFEEIWSDVFVTDAALTQCIKDIRRQLGDDAANPRYIKTVPKHGYIFIGNAVEAATDEMIRRSSLSALTDSSAAARAGEASQRDDRQREARRREAPRFDAPVSSAEISLQSQSRPYKFLDYYTERDAQLFFGREPEVEAICSQILAHRSFILHGRSGVGKSSILRAGLMPCLKSEGHQVFVIRSFIDPLHQIMTALGSLPALDESEKNEIEKDEFEKDEFEKDEFEKDKFEKDEASLEDLIRRNARRGSKRCVIFFLDQFEEFFTLLSEEMRNRFLDAAGRLLNRETPLFRLVFALREDMLAEMSQLKISIPEIFHHEYRLKRLSRDQAALAITGPANAVGCQYEPQLVARLLDDLSDEDGIDPPQLQIVCDNLYDSRGASNELTLAIYNRLGGASQILAGYLERVLRRFNRADLEVVKEILTALITADGRRLVLSQIELEARIRNQASRASISADRLIEELVAARVVRRRSQDGEAWLELAHDFLTPEVSRWLSADRVALKRARGIIERAMENYQTHRLLIDADALDLLEPFGEQLGLTGKESDLLTESLLGRAQSAPEWLINSSPSSSDLIIGAASNSDSDVRLRAVEAACLLRGDEMRELLCRLALWDEHLMVRKAASIALADWLGRGAGKIISEAAEHSDAGLVRRSISLAMVRDYDKRLIELGRLSIPVSLLVTGGLMWVRLRRGGAEIVRQGIGGALGGAASGCAGGMILSMGLSAARRATVIEATELFIVLVTLGSFIGAIGGLGVSFGMISAARVAYRHSRWWSVIGGAAGGAFVGGSSKLLGVDTVKALFGQSPTGITGAFEGAVIGIGVSLGAVLTSAAWPRAASWQKALGASLGAMCAGVLLTIIGGNLFSGSLEIVARMFANSQMRMDPLAPFFGEVHFGRTTQLICGAIEGLLFGAGVMSGIEFSARANRESPDASSTGA